VTFRSIVDSAYAEVIGRGVSEGAFLVDDVGQAARIVRAIIDRLFLQWLQEADWDGPHRCYQQSCERAVLAYLRVEDSAAGPAVWIQVRASADPLHLRRKSRPRNRCERSSPPE
jgi:hypothetical protein